MGEPTFSYDWDAVALVRDEGDDKAIGTAFSFIKPHWFVTAKHVAVTDGGANSDLAIVLKYQGPTRARVLFEHPEVDLAVLVIDAHGCRRPLFPAHSALAGAAGLVAMGYAPSENHPNCNPTIRMTHIRAFQVEIRQRRTLDEETIVFAAPEFEGGHSGGPIFGAGGGVVGAIIEGFVDGGQAKARATSLMPLVSCLTLGGMAGS